MASQHRRAALAALRWAFAERQLLTTEEFTGLCERLGLARAIGLSKSHTLALENLHRLRLLVPLLVSPKGSNSLEVLSYDDFLPWSEHGRPHEGGWVELYYHPCQALIISRITEGLGHRAVELLATRPPLPTDEQTAGAAPRGSIDAYAASWRDAPLLADFYLMLAYVPLADAHRGLTVRGTATARPTFVQHLRHGHMTPGLSDAKLKAWDRWRSKWTKEKVRDFLAVDSARLRAIVENAWQRADFRDPLRAWDDLLPFIDWRQRELLKGEALLSHLVKDMCTVVAALIAYGEGGSMWDVLRPGESQWMTKRLGGPLDRASVEQREFVCNRFGLNPRVNVLLFVEGASEQVLIERLSAGAGGFLKKHGVVLKQIEGVGGLKALRDAIEVARETGARAMVIVDEGDQGVRRHVRRLLESGVLQTDDVLYNSPTLEAANFSSEEVDAARRAVRERNHLEHIDLAEFAAPKQEVAEVLAETILVPEIASGLSGPDRPIIVSINSVLRAAVEQQRRREIYHPNIRPPPTQPPPPEAHS